jgi:hypothetical protein
MCWVERSLPHPQEFAEQASNHFKNLFEMPVLFYVACVAAALTDVTADCLVYRLLWVYYFARLGHSVVHLTYNNPVHRLCFFALSVAALLTIWGFLVPNVFA